ENTLDLGRMKVAATDVNSDGKTDIVALYDDGGTSVRILVWLSNGTSFQYQGPQGWWRSDSYAWSRTRAVLAGNFFTPGRSGLLLVYQYDNFDMRIHYLESDGKQFVYGGNQGVYDSGPGQYDTARARFAVGHFTRPDGPDQVASIYQYPNLKIRVHVFNPTPSGLQPVNGWAGMWESSEGAYDLARAKVVAADAARRRRLEQGRLWRPRDAHLARRWFDACWGPSLERGVRGCPPHARLELRRVGYPRNGAREPGMHGLLAAHRHADHDRQPV